MAEPIQINPAAKAPEQNTPKKTRPTKVIPTERLKLERQLDILRAFAAASGPSGKPVTNKEVADILKMADTSVSLANYFFTETGLLVKGANGIVPSPEVVSYGRAHDWNPATAAHKLGPLLSKAWFAEALTPKLSFRAMDEDEAINTLADASAASPDYKPNLRLILEFMEAAGLVLREGTLLRPPRATGAGDPSSIEAAGTVVPDREPPQQSAQPAAQTLRSGVTTAFTQPTEGVVQFHVSVRVEMAEFATWSPDRISAFFSGIAQVLAAKAAIEQRAGKE